MEKNILICFALVLLTLVSACTSNSLVEAEEELFLTDILTGEEIPNTRIQFGKYTNGTYFCGKVILEESTGDEAREKCYDLMINRQIVKAFIK